jgi:hypothetical protein
LVIAEGRYTEAYLLEHEDHISLGGDVDVDHLGWLRSFGGQVLVCVGRSDVDGRHFELAGEI